jgi:hypothetical protein
MRESEDEWRDAQFPLVSIITFIHFTHAGLEVCASEETSFLGGKK